ncbi:hypothetical protein PSTG_08886 [Puccinia striiformis f. sp. tritici PST-78]|uniref:Uncharacterized protein n=1 Tax=Puccinia striiformis f. sp. tritici PST-78 TaxID=1165861 RepID=A0A0L0VF22_9BASI|nr:hypothetical protein PSTG_08886 [Puccinia striiformis f. sp. tritici PST-78]
MNGVCDLTHPFGFGLECVFMHSSEFNFGWCVQPFKSGRAGDSTPHFLKVLACVVEHAEVTGVARWHVPSIGVKKATRQGPWCGRPRTPILGRARSKIIKNVCIADPPAVQSTDEIDLCKSTARTQRNPDRLVKRTARTIRIGNDLLVRTQNLGADL